MTRNPNVVAHLTGNASALSATKTGSDVHRRREEILFDPRRWARRRCRRYIMCCSSMSRLPTSRPHREDRVDRPVRFQRAASTPRWPQGSRCTPGS